MINFIKKNLKLIIIVFVILVLLIIFIFFNPFLIIKLVGNKTIELEYKEKYKELGVKASFFDNDISKNVKIIGKINDEKLGKYTIKYTINKLFMNKTIIRTINVVDKTKPSIILSNTEDLVLCPGKSYEKKDFTAVDNYDGDITKKVKITEKNNKLIYEVSDSSKNKFSIEKNVIYEDKEIPKITLKGKSNLTLNIGDNYTEEGVDVSDNCDSDLTNKVTTIGKVNTKTNGTYTITYSVKDSSNNEVSVKRVVKVVSNTSNSDIVVKNGATYIKGILLVNKKYSIPSSFGKENSEATNALNTLRSAASASGFTIPLRSGYRSYSDQERIYNNYVETYGQAKADTFSAKPGHSEHQTGLAFDVGEIDDNYGETEAGKWLKDNAHKYGFIIRYPKGKDNITGYKYEPWHIRYLGISVATDVYNKGVTLEEYLEVNMN